MILLPDLVLNGKAGDVMNLIAPVWLHDKCWRNMGWHTDPLPSLTCPFLNQ